MKTHAIGKSRASMIGTFIWIGICVWRFAWNSSGSRNGSAAHSAIRERILRRHSGDRILWRTLRPRGHYGRSGIDVTVVNAAILLL